MAKYVGQVKQQLRGFATWKLKHILKDSNERADSLATIVASIPVKETMLLPIYYQLTSSVTTDRVSRIDEAGPSWLTPIRHTLVQKNCRIIELRPTRSRSKQQDFPW